MAVLLVEPRSSRSAASSLNVVARTELVSDVLVVELVEVRDAALSVVEAAEEVWAEPFSADSISCKAELRSVRPLSRPGTESEI